MKILHILNSNNYSGAENVVCQIIEGFRNNNNIEMFYCSPIGRIENVLAEKKIAFCPLKKMTLNELKRVIKMVKPDIIHAHDYKASLMISLLGVHMPIIYHLHNNAPWIKNKNFKTLLFRFACKKASIIYGVSNSIINEFVYAKYIKNKYYSIGNPFDNSVVINKAKDDFCITKKKFDICFCGRLSEAKRPLFLLDIIAEAKKSKHDLSVSIIGDGELKGAFLEKVNELGLNDNVETFGFVSNPFPLIKQSKIFLMPSKWEGFGLAALEALSLGIPVLASPVGGLTEIVNCNNGLLCNDISDFSDEINKLLTDQVYYDEKSKNAKLTGMEKTNISSYISTLKEHYCELVGE